jgi:hypothetical protein
LFLNSLCRLTLSWSGRAGAGTRVKRSRPVAELLEDRLTPSSGVHGVIGGRPLNFASSYGGGPVLNTAHGPIQVDLVFWGTAFANQTQPEAPLITAVQNLLNSSFLGALSQYDKVSGQSLPAKPGDVVLSASQTVNSDPGHFRAADNAFDFSDADVQKMLDANIGGVIPSPPADVNGLPASNFLYLVITEAKSEDTNPMDGGGVFGIHGIDPANTPRFYYGWTINDGTVPTVISTLSHELIESITDPDGTGPANRGGFILARPSSQAGNEFCDGLGEDFLANINGVDVQSYFSQADNAYIIPTGGQENIIYSTKGVLTVLGGQLGLPADNITISLGSTGGIQVQENNDTFLFDSAATVEANAGHPITSIVVNGRIGNTRLTLDFSNGNFVPANSTLTFIGGTGGHNTLHITGMAAGLTNTWTVSGFNKGTAPGHVAFSNVANLVGDATAADNIFKFVSSGSLTGTINGGSTTGNWLDFSSVPGSIKANLSAATSMSVPADSATRVNAGQANGISNIQNILGSSTGHDTLIGSALGSVLVGHGAGNILVSTTDPSILISGSGDNTLIGGKHDLLIVGRTTYDQSTPGLPSTFNIAVLSAILAELQSTSTPFTRANLDVIKNNALLPLQVRQTVFLSTASAAFQLAHVTAPGDDWIFTEFAASFPNASSANFFD